MKIIVSFDNPLTHRVRFDLHLSILTPGWQYFYLPSWRPGRYEMANYAQYVYPIKALFNGKDVSPDLGKLYTHDWALELEEGELILSYDFYAFQMDAGGSWLDDEQLYLNFINCIIFHEYHKDEPITIELKIPESYKVATALKKEGDNIFKANNLRELYDSPLIASENLKLFNYQIGQTNFYVWFNTVVSIDPDSFIKDFEAFSKEQIALFEEFPCNEYHFLIQLLPYKHYHGVEHAFSTVITLGPDKTAFSGQQYKDMLGIASHELFHTWNVTRMMPDYLIQPNLTREQCFESGFIAEGITTYYGDLMLKRSGVFSIEEYLDELNLYLKRHYDNPGHDKANLVDSSHDLWLDGYKPGVPGRKVSIYIKGALVALLLDLKIRIATNFEKSLDHVLRLMWEEFKSDESYSGYSIYTYQEVLYDATGLSWGDYIDDYVCGTRSLDDELIELLPLFGLDYQLRENDNLFEAKTGVKLRLTGDTCEVIQIAEDSDAFNYLSVKDKVLKINGKEVTSSYLKVFDEQECVMTINRFGREKTVSVNLEGSHFHSRVVTLVKESTKEQIENRRKWLG